jgi:type IV secretion system protein VirD4
MSVLKSETKSEATAGSILITLMNRLAVFSDPVLLKNISDSTFTPQDLRKKPLNIFVKYDITKSNLLSPYLAVFYSVILDKLMDMDDTKMPVICMLDELQQLGRIPKFDNITAFARDFRICIMSAVQNYSKLADIYGANGARTIVGNHAIKLILPGNMDLDLNNLVSTACDGTEITRFMNGKEEKINKPLFTPGEVRRLSNDDSDNEDKVLIIAGHHQPILDFQDNWYKDKEYKKNSEV